MDSVKCYNCKKVTNLICHKCQKPICSKHSYTTHHHFYCATCFLRERKVGMAKSWGMLAVLIAIGIVIVIIAKG
ncbi:hypothetical protein [Candidatus Lokiarchaeum ossiferum]|uniref:hypothetical protein n=1 Tax=Candidatus Lokiarchaeum ossiferum TaxID=2951803 RepID=UPI00352DC278